MADSWDGNPKDLYSIHIRANMAATYTGTPLSDDFRQNACDGLPYLQGAANNTARKLNPAYATNALVDGWQGQCRQKETQV